MSEYRDEEEQMAQVDYDGMNDAEVYALMLLDEKPISRAKIIRLMLLANIQLDLGLKFDKGYSKDVDEALENLYQGGHCHCKDEGFYLSPYGEKVREIAVAQEFWAGIFIRCIRKSFPDATGKDLVAITSYYYPDARDETIWGSVKPYIDQIYIDGTPLSEYSKERFEENLGARHIKITRKGEGVEMNKGTEKKESDNNQMCCICAEKDRRIEVCGGDAKSVKCGSSKVPHRCPGFVPGNIPADRRE